MTRNPTWNHGAHRELEGAEQIPSVTRLFALCGPCGWFDSGSWVASDPVRRAARWKAKGGSFGRQLYKLSRQQHISGESFAMAAQVLLDKWAARGCDPKVLATVRKDVFDIGEPKK